MKTAIKVDEIFLKAFQFFDSFFHILFSLYSKAFQFFNEKNDTVISALISLDTLFFNAQWGRGGGVSKGKNKKDL